MADKKITQLTALTAPANNDLLLIVDDPSGSPVSKKVELGDIFGETAQTTFQTIKLGSVANTEFVTGGTFKITPTDRFLVDGLADFDNDRIRVRTAFTPGSSNAAAASMVAGEIAWDANYLYVAVGSTGANSILRVALSGW
jgi:hypothetical protein